jgi:glutamyl-tRNA reductase
MHPNCFQARQDTPATPALFLVGLNHRSAPLSLRERLALTPDETRRALVDLIDSGLHEAVIVATCNRLEIYGSAADSQLGSVLVAQYLSEQRGLRPEQLEPHLYAHHGPAAVQHLMRVAAGADSMILGEAQILGQVSQAQTLAQEIGSAGPVLSHLFTLAAHAGKRARSETDISRHITSVSHAAAHLAQASIPHWPQVQALVVGSGEMAYLAAQALQRQGVPALRCINRTYRRAQAMARTFAGEALDWHQLPQALAAADVVITATAAPHTVIQARMVEQALAGRADRPLVLIDIALPRDVDAEVRALPGVVYHDLDDLKTFVDNNIARREAALSAVDTIIAEEAARFAAWYQGRALAPVITALREKAVALAHDEVEAALRRLGDLEPGQQKVVELMAHRIVNRLLHEPTMRLKAGAAGDHAPCYASIVRDLFALDSLSAD